MANPLIPGISVAEQDVLYQKLNEYNLKKASFKEVGAYVVVLPRPDHPRYSLWIYSPLPARLSFFYIFDLSTDINETLRMASSLCYYSSRPLLLVEYNAKRMRSKGDDIISVGKYHGHYLHEILQVDPGYLTWIAFKFTPRIPKQERFVQIARIYHSVYLDILQRRAKQHPTSNFLGKEGDKIGNLSLTVLSVRLEDDPYKTQVKGTTPYFYVRQVLKLKDAAGNFVTFRVSSHVASRESCRLPAVEHAYQEGEILQVLSARIARTYIAGNTKYTRLTHVKIAY
ncbi:MAG: hypothetical protein LUE99_04760 [Bacteroides sp.]|nr:hypothetical protein [Bacteroides sp.]